MGRESVAQQSAHRVAKAIASARFHRRQLLARRHHETELEADKALILRYSEYECECDDEYVCGPCLARREVNRGEDKAKSTG